MSFKIRPLAFAVALCAIFSIFGLRVEAQTSVWTGAGGDGLWGDTNNWANQIVPNASGVTADFSQYDLIANSTVHLNEPVTVGQVIFGNSAANPGQNWTVDDDGNTTNTLTLAPATSTFAGGTCTITITNMGSGIVDFSTATIAGTNGLVKDGPGFLEIDGTCTYSNGTTIMNGTFFVGTGATAGETNATDIYTLGGSGNYGPAILRENMGGHNLSNPINCAPGSVGPLMLGEYKGAKCNFTFPYVNLNGNTLIITNGADNTGGNNFVVSPSGSGITNNGNVIVINNETSGTSHFSSLLNNPIGVVTLEDANPWTSGSGFSVTASGNVTGINYIAPVTAGYTLPFTAPANPNGVNITNSSVKLLGPITLPAGLSNVMLNANSGPITVGTVNASFLGSIINSGTGTGVTTISASMANTSKFTNMVQSSATSPLILSGTNVYTAPTLVQNGTLLVNGSIGAGSVVTVASGGTLGGIGGISGPVMVQAGGTLAPGTNDGFTLGTLTNSGSLTLNGNLFFKLNTSSAQLNDFVTGTAALTNVGTGMLIVTNVGPGLVTGEVFQLFSQPLLGGNNLTIVGPATFINNLAVDGSIQVGAPSSSPVITAISPANGSTAGGAVVNITGTGFANGDTVQFGSLSGTSVTVNSSTGITVTTPANAPGAVNVTVTDAYSQNSTLTNGFTYSLPPPPVITSLSPNSGPTTGDTAVTITGSNFLSGDTVMFGSGSGAAVTVNSSTTVTATTPSGSAGMVNVTVTDASSQSSTLLGGFNYVQAVLPGSAAVVITNMPAYGTYGANCFISGYVTNASFATNCVLVYAYWPNENPNPTYEAKLAPWGWFSMPTFTNALVPINPDGTWSCNMPSNFNQYAEEFCVLLAPTNWSQSVATGLPGLVSSGIAITQALATVYADRPDTYRRQINWAGYGWWVKTAGSAGDQFLARTGPGPNSFSDSTNNVWVDSQGLMHLQITGTNSSWQCVELFSDESFGYGQYRCTLNASMSNLDENAIFSMFTWSDDDDYVNREVDMEVSYWGGNYGPLTNEDYAISPYDTGQVLRMALPQALTNSTHVFVWTPTNVAFETLNGGYSPSPASSNIVESWSTMAPPIPLDGGENISLILWLYKGHSPVSGKPVQVTLSDFKFEPYGPPQPAQMIQPQPMSNGQFQFSVQGVPQAHYEILSTTNLMNWPTNGTLIRATNQAGVFPSPPMPPVTFQFTDTNPPASGPNFYNVLTEP